MVSLGSILHCMHTVSNSLLLETRVLNHPSKQNDVGISCNSAVSHTVTFVTEV